MKSKQVVITIEGQSKDFFIGAVPGINNNSKEKGFLAKSFPSKDGTPTDPQKGELIADILFPNEETALIQGEKMLKAKIKAAYALQKKRFAAEQKAAKQKTIKKRK